MNKLEKKIEDLLWSKGILSCRRVETHDYMDVLVNVQWVLDTKEIEFNIERLSKECLKQLFEVYGEKLFQNGYGLGKNTWYIALSSICGCIDGFKDAGLEKFQAEDLNDHLNNIKGSRY